jgi:hypothetical protein
MDFTHAVLTAMLTAYGIVQAWSFAKVFQVLGTIVSIPSRSELSLEAAIAILRELKGTTHD